MFKPLSPLPPKVVYFDAESWGLSDAEARRRGLTAQPGNLPELYIHHTAGQYPDLTVTTWDDDPVTFTKELDRRAREVQKYKAIDYSFIIHTNGLGIVSIVEGRGLHFPAATLDRNTQSKAICFAGDFRAGSPFAHRPPSTYEITAARWLISELRTQGVLAPWATGRAHRDNPAHPGATACCGDLLIPLIPSLMVPYTPDPKIPAPTLRRGDRGIEVKALSELFVFFGLRKRVTERFGLGMQRNVKKMQANLGTPVTGVYNQVDARALAKAFAGDS